MCSVSFEIAPSKPIPASTLTAIRSSASGSSARIRSFRERAFPETTKSGAMKPTPPSAIAAKSTPPGPAAAPPKRAPVASPPSASADLKARKVVGEILRPRPAASSRALTPSMVVFGCSFSVQPASRSPSGASTRWLKGSCCWPSAARNFP